MTTYTQTRCDLCDVEIVNTPTLRVEIVGFHIGMQINHLCENCQKDLGSILKILVKRSSDPTHKKKYEKTNL